MIKQAVIIRYEDKPVMCCAITTFQSAEDFAKFERECKHNFEEFARIRDSKIEELYNKLVEANEKIFKLECENKYNRGEITEKEFNELCGLNQ